LLEVVAMGDGGMVPGVIYAVVVVAMAQAGNAVPISSLIVGVVTLLTAYSYLIITLHFGEQGGVFAFLEQVDDGPIELPRDRDAISPPSSRLRDVSPGC
jgi:amino acid transporter